MATSAARQARRAQARAEQPKPGAEATAPPREEVNFLLPPGGLLPSEDAVKGSPVKGKTVKVPDALNRHIQDFKNRHDVEFTKGALALWRALMREDAAMIAEAKEASRKSGLPVAPKSGPIYRAMLAELEMMRDEQSGAIFEQ
ncbi:hypothetical protein [Streptomyces sp. NPDC059761]|uniref:hypothetical protein n=1 Tax=Streptomyces sp. NPDC059761 TaxID=3346937 RepID=UPI00366014BA